MVGFRTHGMAERTGVRFTPILGDNVHVQCALTIEGKGKSTRTMTYREALHWLEELRAGLLISMAENEEYDAIHVGPPLSNRGA